MRLSPWDVISQDDRLANYADMFAALGAEPRLRILRALLAAYTANTAVLKELLEFLYAECCTRNKAIKPAKITHCCE